MLRTRRWMGGTDKAAGRGLHAADPAGDVWCGWLFLLLVVFWVTVGLPRTVAAQADAVARGGSAIYPGLEVNIADGGKLARLLLAFEVQCVDERAAQLTAAPLVREAIVLFLRDKTVAELSTPKGRGRLRDELVGVINKALGAPRAVRIYFTQFVII